MEKPTSLIDSSHANKNDRSGIVVNRKPMRKKSCSAFFKLVWLPSWNPSELRLLEALVMCARNDPESSQFLALGLYETDEEEQWREMEKPRIEFLQFAGSIGNKLWEMIEDAKEMRRELKLMEVEMEEEETKVRSLKCEAQHLTSEILEVICVDSLLNHLSTPVGLDRELKLRTPPLSIWEHSIKRRKKKNSPLSFKKMILSLFKYR